MLNAHNSCKNPTTTWHNAHDGLQPRSEGLVRCVGVLYAGKAALKVLLVYAKLFVLVQVSPSAVHLVSFVLHWPDQPHASLQQQNCIAVVCDVAKFKISENHSNSWIHGKACVPASWCPLA